MQGGGWKRDKSATAPTLADPQVRRAILGSELRKARATLARDRAPSQLDTSGSTTDFLTWSAAIPTVSGVPLDFDRFPFQPAIYRVLGDRVIKDVVVMKSTQVGASEGLARMTLYFADVDGATALYVFPADKQMRDFADTRIDRLREVSEYLRRRAGQPWHKGLKRIGDGVCLFRGSQAKNDLIAVAADVLVLDEYDSLSPENIPEAEQRIAGSQLALMRRVGVPSDPEYGIAKLCEESDQRRWYVDCEQCGERQDLVFHENVRWDEDQAGLIVNDRSRLPRTARTARRAQGQWIGSFPTGLACGFHVHRLMVWDADLIPADRGQQEA